LAVTLDARVLAVYGLWDSTVTISNLAVAKALARWDSVVSAPGLCATLAAFVWTTYRQIASGVSVEFGAVDGPGRATLNS